MTFLEYAKQFHNFDVVLMLVDEAGMTDEEIMTKFDVSKQRIYDAKKRLDPIIDALSDVSPRKDNRNKDIQHIIDAFETAFGTTKSNAYDRYAAKRLFVKYGEDIINVINALANHGGEKYCPVVNNVAMLENKLPQIVAYLKQNNSQVINL